MGEKAMTLLIAGTIPDKTMPLTVGVVDTDGDHLTVDGHRFPCTRRASWLPAISATAQAAGPYTIS
jgi:hypothetical protein